mgnify:FL=1
MITRRLFALSSLALGAGGPAVAQEAQAPQCYPIDFENERRRRFINLPYGSSDAAWGHVTGNHITTVLSRHVANDGEPQLKCSIHLRFHANLEYLNGTRFDSDTLTAMELRSASVRVGDRRFEAVLPENWFAEDRSVERDAVQSQGWARRPVVYSGHSLGSVHVRYNPYWIIEMELPQEVIRDILAGDAISEFSLQLGSGAWTMQPDGLEAFTARLQDDLREAAQTLGDYVEGRCVAPLPPNITSSECFVTTAACSAVGLADDCWELTQLRAFRDGWLAQQAYGAQDIAAYYALAPAALGRLSARPDARRLLIGEYWRTIIPCAVFSALKLNALAYARYRAMMARLQALTA